MTEKQCSVCGETKSITEFLFCHSYGGKKIRRKWCRACRNAKQREYLRRPEVIKARAIYQQSPERKIANRVLNRKYTKWRWHNSPEARIRIQARGAVYRAVRDGKLFRPQSCSECGIACKPESHHHRGYEPENWLEVIWVCKRCHGTIHQHGLEGHRQ